MFFLKNFAIILPNSNIGPTTNEKCENSAFFGEIYFKLLNAVSKMSTAFSISSIVVYLPTDNLTVDAAISGVSPLLIKTFDVPDPAKFFS